MPQPRITRLDLDGYVTVLNERLPGCQFSIAYSGHAAQLRTDRWHKAISPLRSKREIYDWICAMLATVDYATAGDRFDDRWTAARTRTN